MAITTDYSFQRMTLEIRYDEGIIYLDRCGSLMLALQRTLGKPFRRTNVPTLDYGELLSALERLVVRYGPENLIVEHVWVETPTRLQKIAPLAWAEVSQSLGVENKVNRCGFRVMTHWATDSVEEAERVLTVSGLLQETPSWRDLFGAPTTRALTTSSERAGGRKVRATLGVIEVKIEGRILPDERKFAAPCAVQLDLDFSLTDPGKLEGSRLKAFLTASVADVKKFSDEVGLLLHDNRA